MNGNGLGQLNGPLKTLGQARARRDAASAKLSSGLAIQSAKDNAAGLAISINIDAELKSLQQASRNTAGAMNVLQTAEGGMSNSADAIVRMKELAVQAANGSLNSDQRAMIQEEIDTLKSSLDQVAHTTEFNDRSLLDGTEGTLTFQVGTGSDAANQVTFETPDLTAAALGLDGASVATQADATALMDAADSALDTLNAEQSQVGATINQLERSYDNVQESIVNNTDALSRLRDTDFASESTEHAQAMVLEEVNISMLAQANATSKSVLKLLG